MNKKSNQGNPQDVVKLHNSSKETPIVIKLNENAELKEFYSLPEPHKRMAGLTKKTEAGGMREEIKTEKEQAIKDLIFEMSEISEAHYCAGWMNGLEFSLWEMIIDRSADRQYGMCPITDEQLDRLLDLSRECGGWIFWLKDTGETFLKMETWLKFYDDYKASLPK